MKCRCDWKPARCEICNMVIIIRDLEMHENKCREKNTRPCKMCGQYLTASAAKEHGKTCPKKLVSCNRCKNLFPADVVLEHTRNCAKEQALKRQKERLQNDSSEQTGQPKATHAQANSDGDDEVPPAVRKAVVQYGLQPHQE